MNTTPRNILIVALAIGAVTVIAVDVSKLHHHRSADQKILIEKSKQAGLR